MTDTLGIKQFFFLFSWLPSHVVSSLQLLTDAWPARTWITPQSTAPNPSRISPTSSEPLSVSPQTQTHGAHRRSYLPGAHPELRTTWRHQEALHSTLILLHYLNQAITEGAREQRDKTEISLQSSRNTLKEEKCFRTVKEDVVSSVFLCIRTWISLLYLRDSFQNSMTHTF